MLNQITRRRFARTVAAAAALCGMSTTRPADAGAATQPPAAALQPQSFPPGFLWGCATSAYQIEGAVAADGRGASIWDTFSHTPGRTANGETGDVADDSYHRYPEDIALLKNLGATTYRFSISWSRVFPEGRGSPDERGMAYYERLVDALLRSGIQPYATLFHWDLPQALAGGWQSRDTAAAFADYAAYVTRRLSDRVRHFMTTNELVCFTDLSYKIGQFAPGLRLGPAQVNQIRHHALLAHGLGVQAIRASAARGTQVGLAENPTAYVPAVETPQHVEAAKRAFREENAPFLTAVMEGAYTEGYLTREGANAPKVQSGDMQAIGSPLDFVGLNVYQPEYVRADASPSGYAILPKPASFPRMASPWLFIGPEVIYWAVRATGELWRPKAIYITENGCSSQDTRDAAGRVEDTDRVMFLRNYLTHLQRAVLDGYPVKGYFLWSLLDNYEWADGYEKRFGIHYVDFATQQRIPKLSAEWYRQVIAHNAVL
jgi:beta-glucosidase